MNDQPSLSSILFPYLLIPAAIGLAIALNATNNSYPAPSVTANGKALADNLAIINAEAALPIYDLPEKHDKAASRAAHGTLVPGTSATAAAALQTANPVAGNTQVTWHLNIASLTNPDQANRIVLQASEQGIEAAKEYVTVNGKGYWRVFVNGFESKHEAASHAALIKERLGLKEFWISKAS